jgi:hypothetical protein
VGCCRRNRSWARRRPGASGDRPGRRPWLHSATTVVAVNAASSKLARRWLTNPTQLKRMSGSSRVRARHMSDVPVDSAGYTVSQSIAKRHLACRRVREPYTELLAAADLVEITVAA